MNIEKSSVLPQFPLPIVAFPGEFLNLHIFESRYIQLINDCLENNGCFGIAPFYKGELIFYGTEMKLVEITKKYNDGKMDIKTHGQRLYHIHQFEKEMKNKLYPAANVSYPLTSKDKDQSLSKEILEKIKILFKHLKINKPIPELEENFSSFKIAHHVGLSMDDKIQLLTIRSEIKRLILIKNHLNEFLPRILKAEEIKERAAMNGHFRHLNSPDF